MGSCWARQRTPVSRKTISSATLDLTSCSKTQDPFAGSLAGIWVGELQYALPLDQTDYDISGTAVVSQALAYQGLAYYYSVRNDWFAAPNDAMPKMRAAAESQFASLFEHTKEYIEDWR